MKKTIVIILSLVVVGGISFYGGIKYNQSKTVAARSNRFSANIGNNFAGRTGGNMNGSVVSGEVLSKDDKSITVKTRDGGYKIVFYSSKTTVGKSVDGSIADIKVGEQVNAIGSAGQDGIISADSIQIRPVMPTSGNINK